MSTYRRNGKVQEPNTQGMPATSVSQSLEQSQAQAQTQPKDAIRINGYQQVFEMLKAADAEFRESLLLRMAAHDKRLVMTLRRELAAQGY